jgi:hypothetical protein
MVGKSVPFDFDIRWQNDFIKAQRGTFVPFTLIVDASLLSRPAALVYVSGRAPSGKASEKKPKGRDRAVDAPEFPVDAIFPVELTPTTGRWRASAEVFDSARRLRRIRCDAGARFARHG